MVTILMPNNDTLLFDILTLIISLLAIITSIVAAWYSFKSSKNINNINLNSIYHNKIFDNIILEKLPKSVDQIKFRDGKLVDEEALERFLGELKNKIIFYKYKNKIFYKDLSQLIIEIDDRITLANNEKLDENKFYKIKRNIELKVNELYDVIGNEYIGQRKKNR